MKQKTNNKSRQKTRRAEPLFPDEWIAGLRDNLRGMEELNLDKDNRTFSRSAKLSAAYFCLAIVAMQHHTKKEKNKILLAAEKIHNRFGVSMFEKRSEVAKCLPKRHEECLGSYVSLHVKAAVKCNCPCHTVRRDTAVAAPKT